MIIMFMAVPVHGRAAFLVAGQLSFFFCFDFCNSNRFIIHKEPHEWIPVGKEFLMAKRDEVRSMR
jgi:hypothetical protein